MPIPLEIGTSETPLIEYIDRGHFKYTTSKTSEGGRVVDITAHDSLYNLEEYNYDFGYIGSLTLSNAVKQIVTNGETESAKLEYVIDSDVSNRLVYMAIEKTDVKEALRLVCQAARCWIFMGADGLIHVVDGSLKSQTQRYTGDMLLDDVNADYDGDDFTAQTFGTYEYIQESTTTVVATYEITYGDRVPGAAVYVELEHDPVLTRTVSISNSVSIVSKMEKSSFWTGIAYFPVANTTVKITITARKYNKNDETQVDPASVTTYNPAIVPDGVGGNAEDVSSWYNSIASSNIKYSFSEQGSPALELSDPMLIEGVGDGKRSVIYKEEYKLNEKLECNVEAVNVNE